MGESGDAERSTHTPTRESERRGVSAESAFGDFFQPSQPLSIARTLSAKPLFRSSLIRSTAHLSKFT